MKNKLWTVENVLIAALLSLMISILIAGLIIAYYQVPGFLAKGIDDEVKHLFDLNHLINPDFC